MRRLLSLHEQLSVVILQDIEQCDCQLNVQGLITTHFSQNAWSILSFWYDPLQEIFLVLLNWRCIEGQAF